jgi:glycine/D-amino acid oxidase-like deaminating enzyme/nitrite reductase/ring-hydroxylating ferredoxin subunit
MKLDKEKLLQALPESYWLSSAKNILPEYPALSEDIKTDVLVIGGGIAGVTSAYLLKKEGLSVAVLEADRIASGTTGHTTAKITSQHQLIYHRIMKQMGEEFAKQYADANETAIKQIKNLIDELKIDCDFVSQPAFVFTEKDDMINALNDEFNAAQSLGIQAQFVESIPFPFTVKGAVKFDGQAQFHPVKYTRSVAKAFASKGGHIYESTRAVQIEDGTPCTIRTEQGNRITAGTVIIATHYPFYNKHGLYFTRIYQDRSYVTAIKAPESYPGGMYINAEEPVRSLRSQVDGDGTLVLISGARHKTGQCDDTKKKYEELLDFASPYYTISSMPYHWSAQDCLTVDGLPYVGNFTADTPNLYITTGFGKWGMTNSMASAMLLRDLILKGESSWRNVYDPSRKTKAACAVNFVVENFNTAEKLIGGKIESLPKDDEIDIPPGEGKVIELYGKRAGAYRDNEGILYIVNTTCPHMGCELNWNSAEKTWDCPCHGSRFTYEGKVLEGPAVENLSMDKDVNTIGKLLTQDF